MINLELNLGINNTATTSSSNSQLSSLTAQSFSTTLSEALSETLSQFGIDPSSVTLTVSPGQSQTNAASQNSDASSQNSAATTVAAATIVSPFSQAAAIAAFPGTAVMTPSVSAPSSPSTSTPSTTSSGAGSSSGNGSQVQSASLPVSESYDDAYWAQQPPAVQQLRNITDYQTREQLGTQLAQDGYTIDVPIMVWGWDPSKVMATREAAGYTWVPSGLQQPVEMAPGITMPGVASYDPNNAPAGSIRV